MTRRNFRRCLMEPIIEHRLAADLLSIAANSLLAGDFRRCASFLAQADMRELREFAYKVAGPISFEIHRQTRMPQFTPTTIRGIKRMPSKIIERQIYKRDGWHCRYCESRVISKEARNIFRRYFPVVARKGRTNEDNHFGLATLSATLDHLVPHKRGGSNEPENLVTACGPCQFGRGVWLLEEVQIEDPRNRSPILDGWDGLTRLLHKKFPNISSQPTAYGGGRTQGYKGFPTFASNTSPWIDRAAINPGMVFVDFRSVSTLCMQRVDASWQTVRTARLQTVIDATFFVGSRP